MIRLSFILLLGMLSSSAFSQLMRPIYGGLAPEIRFYEHDSLQKRPFYEVQVYDSKVSPYWRTVSRYQSEKDHHGNFTWRKFEQFNPNDGSLSWLQCDSAFWKYDEEGRKKSLTVAQYPSRTILFYKWAYENNSIYDSSYFDHYDVLTGKTGEVQQLKSYYFSQDNTFRPFLQYGDDHNVSWAVQQFDFGYDGCPEMDSIWYYARAIYYRGGKYARMWRNASSFYGCDWSGDGIYYVDLNYYDKYWSINHFYPKSASAEGFNFDEEETTGKNYAHYFSSKRCDSIVCGTADYLNRYKDNYIFLQKDTLAVMKYLDNELKVINQFSYQQNVRERFPFQRIIFSPSTADTLAEPILHEAKQVGDQVKLYWKSKSMLTSLPTIVFKRTAHTEWMPIDTLPAGFQAATDPNVSVDSTYLYKVMPESEAGFIYSNVVSITISQSAKSPSKDGILIAPNPGLDRVVLPATSPGTLWTITDLAGVSMSSGTLQGSLEIDISKLQPGFYMIVTRDGAIQRTNRLMKL